jgi:hypothetical protein
VDKRPLRVHLRPEGIGPTSVPRHVLTKAVLTVIEENKEEHIALAKMLAAEERRRLGKEAVKRSRAKGKRH